MVVRPGDFLGDDGGDDFSLPPNRDVPADIRSVSSPGPAYPPTNYYILPTIDLSKQVTNKQLMDKRIDIYSVSVFAAPPGYVATVQFGIATGAIPLPPAGQTIKILPSTREGLFITVPAGQAGSLLLAVNVELYGTVGPTQDQDIIYSRYLQAGSVNAGPSEQLYNPVGSGVLIRIKKIYAYSASAGTFLICPAMYRQLSNNGGGVLTLGTARYLDRRLAPANPVASNKDANIAGIIAGSTFDNLQYSDSPYSDAAGLPVAEVTFSGVMSVNVPELPQNILPFPIYLPQGTGCNVGYTQNGAGVTNSVYFIGNEL